MSVATVAGSLPELPGRRFGKMTIDLEIPGGSFDQYPRAAQRLLIYLWRASNFGADEVRKTTKEIAKACGRSERWVYKAIRQCLDHMQGDDADPLICKRFIKGPREAAGRVLKLLINFAKRKGEEKGKAAGRKARGNGDAKPAAAPLAPTAAAPAGPAEPPEPPPAPGAFKKILAGISGAMTGRAAPPKTEAEMAAEADRKKAEYAAAVARRKADAERQKSASAPPPIDSS